MASGSGPGSSWQWALIAALALGTALDTVAAQGVQTLGAPEKCELAPPLARDLVCSWTADCTVTGCAEQCIANAENLGFADTLADFEFSETSYRMCPIMTIIILQYLTAEGGGPDPGLGSSSSPPSTPPGGSSLQLSLAEGRPGLLERSTGQALTKSLYEQQALAATQTRKLLDQASTGAVSKLGSSFGRQLSNLGLPSPAGSVTIPADMTLECLTGSELTQVGPILNELGNEVEAILTADATGALSEADRVQLDHIVSIGNIWRVMLPYLQDTDLLKEFMAEECATVDFEFPTSVYYAQWVPAIQDAFAQGTEPQIDESLAVRMCADTSEHVVRFAEGLQQTMSFCDTPFNSQPNCYPSSGRLMPSSSVCANTLAASYNVSSDPLQEAVTLIESIHIACTAVTNQADCESAQADEPLSQLQDLRRSFRYKSPLPVDAATGGTGAPLPPESPESGSDGDLNGTVPGVPPPGVISTGQPISDAGPAPGAPVGGGSLPESPLTSEAGETVFNGLNLPSSEPVTADELGSSAAATGPHLPLALRLCTSLLIAAFPLGWMR